MAAPCRDKVIIPAGCRQLTADTATAATCRSRSRISFRLYFGAEQPGMGTGRAERLGQEEGDALSSRGDALSSAGLSGAGVALGAASAPLLLEFNPTQSKAGDEGLTLRTARGQQLLLEQQGGPRVPTCPHVLRAKAIPLVQMPPSLVHAPPRCKIIPCANGGGCVRGCRV